MPTSTAPRLPPPARTNAVGDGLPEAEANTMQPRQTYSPS